jgi:hypothetical protein
VPVDGKHSQSQEQEGESSHLGPAVRTPAERIAAGLSGHPLAVMPAGPPAQQDPAVTDLLQCIPPSSRSGPSFVLTLRRPILFQPPSLLPPDQFGQLSLACTPIVRTAADGTPIPVCTPYYGLDATFAQTWNLTAVTIGDLASTMALAPGEQLTLEFQSSQRKVLEQSTLESTESLSSTESTTADKEAINIARSSSQTEGWHVDTTGTLTCGYASLSVTGGYSKSVTEANQQAINHVHDRTQHSAQSLKALHKIEVRGVSEGIVQNRMTRTITNPYYDRSITLNVFHLLKHFSVQTALAEQRHAIVLRIDDLGFDGNFVLRNTDFLRTNLLDSSLLDDLPVAVQGAKQPLQSTALNSAIDTAQWALAYLYSPPFDDRAPTMFNLPDIQDEDGNLLSQNEPRTSFEINLQHGAVGIGTGRFQDSGFGRANEQKCAVLLTTLGYFYTLIQEAVPDPDNPGSLKSVLQVADNAVRICTALAASVGDLWTKLFPDPGKNDDLKELMDARRFTEVIRRVPGFLAMVSGMLQPLLDPAKAEQAALVDYAQAQFVLQHLLEHLECNRNYYVQRYLRYIAETTANQAIIDLATDALNAVFANPAKLVQDKLLPAEVTIGDFDVDRTFIDKREVIIPGFLPLTDQDVAVVARELGLDPEHAFPPVPAVDPDLEVACDGIYLEVAEGACVLQNVPPRPQLSGSITVKDLEVSLGGQAHSAGG